MVYTYFIVYNGSLNDKSVIGNMEIEINKEINNINDIRAIEDSIEEHRKQEGINNIILLSYKLLSVR